MTRGDANPFTDQDSDEPPVQDGQIVASAWQVNDGVVTIPHLGTAIMTLGETLERGQTWLATTVGVQAFLGSTGLAYLLLVLSGGLYALETVRERRQTTRRSSAADDGDDALDPQLLAGGFALLVVVAATAAMVAPAGTQSYDLISAEFESEQPQIIEQGTTDEIVHTIPNGGYVPVVSYVESGSEPIRAESGPTAVDARRPRLSHSRSRHRTRPATIRSTSLNIAICTCSRCRLSTHSTTFIRGFPGSRFSHCSAADSMA